MRAKVTSFLPSCRLAETHEFEDFHSDDFNSYIESIFEKLESGELRSFTVLRTSRVKRLKVKKEVS